VPSTPASAQAECKDGEPVGNLEAGLQRIPVGLEENNAVVEVSWKPGTGYDGYDRYVGVIGKMDRFYQVFVNPVETVHMVRYCGELDAVKNYAADPETHVAAMISTGQDANGRPTSDEIPVVYINPQTAEVTLLKAAPDGPSIEEIKAHLEVYGPNGAIWVGSAVNGTGAGSTPVATVQVNPTVMGTLAPTGTPQPTSTVQPTPVPSPTPTTAVIVPPPPEPVDKVEAPPVVPPPSGPSAWDRFTGFLGNLWNGIVSFLGWLVGALGWILAALAILLLCLSPFLITGMLLFGGLWLLKKFVLGNGAPGLVALVPLAVRFLWAPIAALVATLLGLLGSVVNGVLTVVGWCLVGIGIIILILVVIWLIRRLTAFVRSLRARRAAPTAAPTA